MKKSEKVFDAIYNKFPSNEPIFVLGNGEKLDVSQAIHQLDCTSASHGTSVFALNDFSYLLKHILGSVFDIHKTETGEDMWNLPSLRDAFFAWRSLAALYLKAQKLAMIERMQEEIEMMDSDD